LLHGRFYLCVNLKVFAHLDEEDGALLNKDIDEQSAQDANEHGQEGDAEIHFPAKYVLETVMQNESNAT